MTSAFLTKTIFVVVGILLSLTILRAQKHHSDNGNGTYTNPVIAADFPDPDIVLVRDTYYMVNTTMFIFPGVTVLRSKDLVNWEYCSNAIPSAAFAAATPPYPAFSRITAKAMRRVAGPYGAKPTNHA